MWIDDDDRIGWPDCIDEIILWKVTGMLKLIPRSRVLLWEEIMGGLRETILSNHEIWSGISTLWCYIAMDDWNGGWVIFCYVGSKKNVSVNSCYFEGDSGSFIIISVRGFEII